MTRYVLTRNALGQHPEILICRQEYEEAKRCRKQIYQAFEIELAFDMLIKNYIEIEKYIAEHLVYNMVRPNFSTNDYRLLYYEFARILNNWLTSISSWRDITCSRLIAICGPDSKHKCFKKESHRLKNDEFETAFLFHLRNYSQHGGLPLTGLSTPFGWNDQFTELTFSAIYSFDYNIIRDYFDQEWNSQKNRKNFSDRIKEYSKGKYFDLKPIIRKSLGIFGKFMDKTRILMSDRVGANECFTLNLLDRYASAHPDSCLTGLSAMRLNDQDVVDSRKDIIPVRSEFIFRARDLRDRNNGQSLAGIEQRIITNK